MIASLIVYTSTFSGTDVLFRPLHPDGVWIDFLRAVSRGFVEGLEGSDWHFAPGLQEVPGWIVQGSLP
jgi:hypothetical protein